MTELLIATNNPGKVSEIKDLLQELKLTLLTLDQAGISVEVAETGHSYADNALIKARAFCHSSGKITLADDSGLEVDALGGLPGIHSARFSPQPGASDQDRRALLLQRLAGIPRPWKARFRCVIALVHPAGDEHLAEGICPGEIIPEERGLNGFGYDPIFWLPDLKMTMAELTMPEKNKRSHRAQAVLAARPKLIEWLQQRG